MLSFVKANGRVLGLAILAVQLLSSAVASSFDLEEMNPALLARVTRGTKSIGALCTSNAECYSANCAPKTTGSTVLTCQLQPTGGPCFKNLNCVSYNCNYGTGKCTTPSKAQGPCKTATDCYGKTTLCVKNVCRYPLTASCVYNADCASGLCLDKQCRAKSAPQVPGKNCHLNSECLSNQCVPNAFRYDLCTDTTGAYVPCATLTSSNCARYPLGHTCANNGECKEGLCKNGVCSAGQVGDTCAQNYQCDGQSLCGTDKKCFLPSAASTPPLEPCNSSSECRSARCISELRPKDSIGVNADPLDTVTLNEPVCDFLDNGQTGCRTYRDCTTGLCQGGTCATGTNGDRCIVNYQCSNICGLDGFCSTLSGPANQGTNELCKTSADCLSDWCRDAQYYGIQRPSLDDPNVLVSVRDQTCHGSRFGQGCHSTADCDEGVCSGGVCSLVPYGGACARSSQCGNMGLCKIPSGGTSGTCVLATGDNDCSRDDQCFSGHCVLKPCQSSCPNGSWCQRVLNQGACRYNSDCSSIAVCGADQKCAVINNAYCEANNDCVSKICFEKVCRAPGFTAPATTSATSTVVPTVTAHP
ncbi:hypothetical protein A4X13_0g4495 [Tilletia indica]|uniref:Uncharacterized protein n=1 Tax=Tilletia indica TaxID=43049 RepID=A0A177T923_9BASI|nr:hypothetical protein A4X13_0g4495 [Tilletia indica]